MIDDVLELARQEYKEYKETKAKVYQDNLETCRAIIRDLVPHPYGDGFAAGLDKPEINPAKIDVGCHPAYIYIHGLREDGDIVYEACRYDQDSGDSFTAPGLALGRVLEMQEIFYKYR